MIVARVPVTRASSAAISCRECWRSFRTRRAKPWTFCVTDCSALRRSEFSQVLRILISRVTVAVRITRANATMTFKKMRLLTWEPRTYNPSREPYVDTWDFQGPAQSSRAGGAHTRPPILELRRTFPSKRHPTPDRAKRPGSDGRQRNAAGEIRLR